MGNVQVTYRRSRAGHSAGTVITNPADWLEEILLENFDTYQGQYNGLSQQQKNAVNAAFGDNVFSDASAAEAWFAEHSLDDDKCAQTKAILEGAFQ